MRLRPNDRRAEGRARHWLAPVPLRPGVSNGRLKSQATEPGIATISRMGREVVGAPCTDAKTMSSCRHWEERGLRSQGVDQTAQNG